MKKIFFWIFFLVGNPIVSFYVFALPGEEEESESGDDFGSNLDKMKEKVAAAKKEAKAADEGSPERQQAQRRADEGISVIEGMGNERPEDSRAQHAVGETLFTVGEYKRVLPFAQREIELKPDKPDGYVLSALAYQKMKQPRAANEAAREALKRDPNNKVAFAIKKLTDHIPEARAIQRPTTELTRAAPALEDNLEQIRPRDEGRDLLENRAQATANHIEAERLSKEAANKMKLDDTEAARRLLDKALILEPQDAAKLSQRASVHFKLGDVKSAFVDANAAVAANDRSGLARVLRARAMAALMPEYTSEQVLADYAAAAELDPSFAAEYQWALAQYGKGAEESQTFAGGADGKASGSRKTMSGGKQAQDLLWGTLQSQARRKWPQGLGVLAGGILLLLWLRKKLRQTIPDKPWQDNDPPEH